MNNKEKKPSKKLAILYYLTALCFYIVAIINFIEDDSSTAVIFLCLGSTNSCLGGVYLGKDKGE